MYRAARLHRRQWNSRGSFIARASNRATNWRSGLFAAMYLRRITPLRYRLRFSPLTAPPGSSTSPQGDIGARRGQRLGIYAQDSGRTYERDVTRVPFVSQGLYAPLLPDRSNQTIEDGDFLGPPASPPRSRDALAPPSCPGSYEGGYRRPAPQNDEIISMSVRPGALHRMVRQARRCASLNEAHRREHSRYLAAD